MDSKWFLYILRCSDGSLYTGITTDVGKRLVQHNSGKGAKYTRGRGPLELVYQKECADHSDALRQEIYVKSLTKQKKLLLIAEKCNAYQK